MATVNVFVQDDLKERLDRSGLDLSAIAQACWERELDALELETGEVRVDAWEDGQWVELRFEGSLVNKDEHGNELYLTTEGVLVFVPEAGAEVDYWTAARNEVTGADLDRFFKDADAVAGACDALGLKVIRRL